MPSLVVTKLIVVSPAVLVRGGALLRARATGGIAAAARPAAIARNARRDGVIGAEAMSFMSTTIVASRSGH